MDLPRHSLILPYGSPVQEAFRKVPRDAWNENMVPLADFLELEASDREGKFRSSGPLTETAAQPGTGSPTHRRIV